jgi:hypothetical protein
MALVVKKFFVSSTPREDGLYVEIVGRDSGLIAWFFALLKLDPNFSLRIFYDKLYYEASSIFGFRKVILPIHSVSSIYFGTVRPWGKALFWFLVFTGAAYGAAQMEQTQWTIGLAILGVVVAILVFIFSRQLTIGVSEITGTDYEMSLQRSMIEGQEISEKKLEEITQIFTALLDAHKAQP